MGNCQLRMEVESLPDDGGCMPVLLPSSSRHRRRGRRSPALLRCPWGDGLPGGEVAVAPIEARQENPGASTAPLRHFMMRDGANYRRSRRRRSKPWQHNG